jgi:hypothetical protein
MESTSTTDGVKKKPRKSPSFYNNQQKIAYVNAWKRSGLSRSEFCRREKLSIATFCVWVHQYQSLSAHAIVKKSPSNHKPDWLPIKLSPNQTLTSPEIEIVLPNSIRLKFSSNVPISTIAQLIQELKS